MQKFALRRIQKNVSVQTLNLTPREQEVLACLFVVSATKQIGQLLSIKPAAVDTHIHHIMQKLDMHSRPHIRDFLEQSGYTQELNTSYQRLRLAYEFKTYLEKVAQAINTQGLFCKIACQDTVLKNRIEVDLGKIGITCFERKKEALTIQVLTTGDVGNYYKTFFEVAGQLISHPMIEEAAMYFGHDAHKESQAQQAKEEPPHATTTKKATIALMIIIAFCFILFVGKGLVSYFGEPPCSIRSELPIPDEAYFLQRPQIIEQIQNKLKIGKGIQTAVLVGMGGMGKTTLARQCGRAQNSGLVWEINAENQKKLLNSFEYLALALAKTPEEKQEIDRIRKTENEQSFSNQLLQFVKQKVAKQKGWLLIFDNVDNFEEIQKFFPNDVKSWGKGRVLITTRDDQIKNNAFIKPQNIIQIQALRSQEQLDLFTKLMVSSRNASWTTEEKNKAETFLKQIPPFPLDVAVTAQYMKNTGIGYDDYLKRLGSIDRDFESSQKTLIQKMTDYDRTRYGIISAALQQLIQKNPEFTGLLLFVSVLNSQDIPKELLAMHKAPGIVEDFIAQMSKHSLLSYNPKGGSLSLHRSTRQNIGLYLQNTLKPETQTKHYERISKTIYDFWIPGMMVMSHQILRNFLPHLYASLEKLRLSPTPSFLAMGRIELFLGMYYNWCGAPEVAIKFLNPSLKNLSLRYGKQINVESLWVITSIGIVNTYYGNFDRAEKLLTKSLMSQKKLETPDKELFVGTMRFLSLCQIALKNYVQGKRTLNETIDFCKKNGVGQIQFSIALSQLARIYFAEGNSNQAIYWHLKSTKIMQNNFGHGQHIGLFGVIFFAQTLIQSGKYVESLKELINLYDIIKKDRTSYSFFVGACERELGNTYKHLACYKEAEFFLKESIKSFSRCLGPNNKYTYFIYSQLGQIYLDRGFYQQAKKILEKNLQNPEKLSNLHNQVSTDINVARILRSLSLIYLHENDYPKSKQYFEKSLALYAKQYGKEHMEYAMTLADYSQFYIRIKDYKVARQMIAQALDILQKHKHPEQYKCHEYRGDLYTAQGQTKKAQTAYITALTIAKQHFPKNSAHIIRLKSKIPLIQRCLLFPGSFLA